MEIFLKYSVTHAGLAMTTGELKRFLLTEQARCVRDAVDIRCAKF